MLRMLVPISFVAAACTPTLTPDLQSTLIESTPDDPSIVFLDDFSHGLSDDPGPAPSLNDDDWYDFRPTADGRGRVTLWAPDDTLRSFDVTFDGRKTRSGKTLAQVDVRDVRLDVDVFIIDAATDTSMGLACRNDGETAILGMVDEEAKATIYWDDGSPFVKVLKKYPARTYDYLEGRNHLRFDCVGSKAALYVNGDLIVEADLPAAASEGTVSLRTSTIGHLSIVDYDNFVVRLPETA